MGDEISFTMVRCMNSIDGMEPIFAICILYIIFCSYCYALFEASFNTRALCAGGVT